MGDFSALMTDPSAGSLCQLSAWKDARVVAKCGEGDEGDGEEAKVVVDHRDEGQEGEVGVVDLESGGEEEEEKKSTDGDEGKEVEEEERRRENEDNVPGYHDTGSPTHEEPAEHIEINGAGTDAQT